LNNIKIEWLPSLIEIKYAYLSAFIEFNAHDTRILNTSHMRYTYEKKKERGRKKNSGGGGRKGRKRRDRGGVLKFHLKAMIVDFL